MEPYKINLSLVPGTAGTYAVAWSEPLGNWLVCLVTHRPHDNPTWLWIDSAATEDDARNLAYARYARDLSRAATR